MKNSKSNNYDLAAYFYDSLSHIYSGFQIRACKRFQADLLTSADNVLFAGAGGAEDAIMAAEKGVNVTIVELSKNMVIKAKQNIEKEGLTDKIRIVHGDIFDHDSSGYDVVVANFFLNVFSKDTMGQMLKHLVSLVKDDGKLMIADFAPLKGNPISRFLQVLYFGSALGVFFLLARNPLHFIYDYKLKFKENNLETKIVKDLGLFGVGPKWYRVIIAQKL